MKALLLGTLYLGREVRHSSAVVIDDGKIEDVVPIDTFGPDYAGPVEVVDLRGYRGAPGFIDVQVNGGGDVLFNESPTVDTARRIVEAHRAGGTTQLFPTFITGSESGTRVAAEAVLAALESSTPGVLGLHLEGPYISPQKAGVHDRKYMSSTLSDSFRNNVLSLLAGRPFVMTVAPEVLSLREIEELSSAGVVIAAGHTNCTMTECRNALEAGVSGATHLYNAMSNMAGRELGAVGSLLLADDTWVDLIPDGKHISFDALKLALRCKPTGKCFFVTDAMPPVGGRQSRFSLPPHEVIDRDGACYTTDGTLAGSSLNMMSGVRNAVEHANVNFDEALRMASTYPAEFAGVGSRYGLIRSGYQADLVVFDSSLRVVATVTGGELRWHEEDREQGVQHR